MGATALRNSPNLGSGDRTAMQRLVVAGRDLAAARDVDAVAETVRHAARELVGADGATFVLRDSRHCFCVAEDAIEPLWRGQRFPLEACISGWAMINQEQVAIADIYLDARIPHNAYRPTSVQSLVMTPVSAERHCHGQSMRATPAARASP